MFVGTSAALICGMVFASLQGAPASLFDKTPAEPVVELLQSPAIPVPHLSTQYEEYLAEPAIGAALAESTVEEPQDISPTQSEPDYDTNLRLQDIPPELMLLLSAVFREHQAANHAHSALLALDVIALSGDLPKLKLLMRSTIGWNYEKLGYMDLAIEQYRVALSMRGKNQVSYAGMRRLDPEFAKSNPEFPKGKAKVE
jgi:hypothetical protein